MQQIIQDSGQTLLALLAGVSLFTFTLSIVCIPWLVSRLPQNYFQNPKEKASPTYSFNTGHLPVFFIRNIIGAFFLLAGIAMLFLPGQGIITIIIGLGIMSFPYKQILLYKLTRPMTIQRSLDWLRKKTGRKSFHW